LDFTKIREDKDNESEEGGNNKSIGDIDDEDEAAV
jgi:hypothetical protein